MRGWTWAVLPLLTWAPPALQAQYSRPSGGFTLDRVSPSTARSIQTKLRSDRPDWNGVLRLFFGERGYDQGIPDLVIYVPPAGAVKQALIHGGREVDNLEGQKFLYFVVFSERTIPPSMAAGPHLAVGVRSLATAPDPFVTSLVKALASQLGTSVPEAEPAEDRDSDLKLSFLDVRADTTSGGRLDVAMGRVELDANSLIRVSIAPIGGFPLDPHLSVHDMFGNSDGSRFGVSLGAGFTLNVRRPTFEDGTQTGTEAYLRSSLYLFGHAYLDRPHLPLDRFGLGVAAGTNLLRGSLLDDLVLGVSIGRLADLGLVVGANLLEWQEPIAGTTQIRSTRHWRPFIGLDFRL